MSIKNSEFSTFEMLYFQITIFLSIFAFSVFCDSSFTVTDDNNSRRNKKTLKCTYSSKEFDIFYNDDAPQSITSTYKVAARTSILTAPLRDFHNASKIVGLWTVREFNALRNSYNIQDYVTTYHFFDKKYPGGSSLIIMSSYFSISDTNGE